VFEKLKMDAQTLKAEEGWKWVDAAIDFPYRDAAGLRRFYGERTELSADELAHYDELKAEYDKLNAENPEATDYLEEAETRLGNLATLVGLSE